MSGKTGQARGVCHAPLVALKAQTRKLGLLGEMCRTLKPKLNA